MTEKRPSSVRLGSRPSFLTICQSDTRVAATAFCLGFLGYLERNGANISSSSSVILYAKLLLEELVKWRP